MDAQVRATLTANAGPFINEMNRAQQATQQFQQRVLNLSSVAVGIGALGLFRYGQAAFAAAAEVSELDRTLAAVARATGKSHRQIVEAAYAIEAMGIEMAASRQIAVKFAQNNLDLAQAAGLARVAQDLAVVSQANSTQTLMRLIHGIMTGNSLVLKNAGVVGQAGQAYADYARQLGVVSTALTPMQRQQAIINMIMKEGEAVAGAYKESMDEPSKVLRSMERILKNIRVAFGQVLLEGLGPVIMAMYDFAKAIAEVLNITPKVNDKTKELTLKTGGLTDAIRGLSYVFIDLMTPLQTAFVRMTEFVKGLSVTEERVRGLVASLGPAVPALLGLATAMAGTAVQTILATTPLGGFAKLIPTWVAGLAMFVFASDAVRSALGRLWEAVQPLVPAFTQWVSDTAAAFVSLTEVAIQITTVFVEVAQAVIGAFGTMVGASDMVGGAFRFLLTMILLARIGLLRFTNDALRAAVTKLGVLRVGIRLTAASFRDSYNLQMHLAAGATGNLVRAQAVATASTTILKGAVTRLGIAIRGVLVSTGIGIAIVALGVLVEWFMRSMATSQAFRDRVEGVLNRLIGRIEEFTNMVLRAADAVNRFFGGDGVEQITMGRVKFAPLEDTDFDFELPDFRFGEDLSDIYDGMDDVLADLEGLGAAGATAAGGVDEVAEAMQRLAERMKSVNAVSKEFDRWAGTITDFSDDITKAYEEVEYQTEEFDRVMADSATTGDELTSTFSSMASAIRSALASALSEARQQLSAAQQAFDQFKGSISSAIMSVLNFSRALPEKQEARSFTGFVKALADSMNLLEESPTETFVGNLATQAQQAMEFGARIRTLLEMGLSRPALEQVIAAGYEAGTVIADEIIAGGVTLVDDINQMIDAMTEVSNMVGEEGANKFFKVGVDIAQSLVDAIIQRIEQERSRIERLIEEIAERLRSIASVEVAAAKAASGSGGTAKAVPKPTMPSPREMSKMGSWERNLVINGTVNISNPSDARMLTNALNRTGGGVGVRIM